MTIKEVNADYDNVRHHIDKAGQLTDQNTEAAFYEAMQDSSGLMSIELVEDYLRVVRDAHQAELLQQKNRSAPKRFTVIHEEMLRAPIDSTSSTPELLGYVASLGTYIRSPNN